MPLLSLWCDPNNNLNSTSNYVHFAKFLTEILDIFCEAVSIV